MNGRYSYEGREDEISAETLERDFDSMSLEYKLYNINQVKSFSKYLNAIGCFYTDRPVDFEMIRAFSSEQIATFAPMEHARWVRAHRAMGWTAGNLYETAQVEGDTKPFNTMLKLIRKFDGLRIYKLD